MTDDAVIRDLSKRQGFTLWRRLPNGVEVLRREWAATHVKCYRAFRGGLYVASWACADAGKVGATPSGHIEGNYARVQGQDADCRALKDWLAAVAALESTTDNEEAA